MSDSTTATRRTSMAAVREANREAGEHWFSPRTMRWFRSKVESGLLNGRFFVTSEREPEQTEADRRYTVRECLNDGTIHTVGEFRQFEDYREAWIVAKHSEPSE